MISLTNSFGLGTLLRMVEHLRKLRLLLSFVQRVNLGEAFLTTILCRAFFLLQCILALCEPAYSGLSLGGPKPRATPHSGAYCNAIAQDFESEFHTAGVHSEVGVDFKKSEAEFEHEAKEATEKHPEIFEDIKNEPEVYRIDQRAPNEIAELGGFFPNPSKKPGTLIDHTVGKSGDTAGTGSYVSFSWMHTEHVLTNEFFAPQVPQRLVYKDKVNGKDLDKITWKKISRKEWDVNSPESERPEVAVFRMFEYRAKDVDGVRVVGGNFKEENEVIIRGVSAARSTQWRVVIIKAPIRYGVKRNPATGKDVIVALPIDAKMVLAGKFSEDRKFSIQYGEWHDLLRVQASP